MDKMLPGRNDPCPCGSGKKYKKCCIDKDIPLTLTAHDLKKTYQTRYGIILKDEKDIEGMRRAGRIAVDTLEMVERHIKPGVKTDDINTLVHEFTVKHGAVPAPLNYRGFPKSVCISINEVVCHGIPGERVLKDGDIVNIDVTPILGGYYADASKTFFVGNPSSGAKKIVQVSRESLKAGLSMCRPGNRTGDIGWAIQKYAELKGCSVVREFVGHGVGTEFHEAPQIPHYGSRGRGIQLVQGMVFTIEPMINLGKKELHILPDRWTAVTNDKSLSAQFEQTIVITEDGYESLTPYDLDEPIII
jgi:methionyl aminopeptidase